MRLTTYCDNVFSTVAVEAKIDAAMMQDIDETAHIALNYSKSNFANVHTH